MVKKRKFGFTDDTLVRVLLGGEVEIHIVSMQTSAEAIFEINSISADGFGLKSDGDVFDETYRYLVGYHTIHKEIISFYRFILIEKTVTIVGKDVVADLATSKFYDFHHEFIFNKLNYAIELGRSVVNKNSVYEKETGKGLSVIWSGLGVLLYEYHMKYVNKDVDPFIKYFFGKWSIQANHYCIDSRDKIFKMFYEHFSPRGYSLDIWPKAKEEFEISALDLRNIELKYDGFNKDKKSLNKVLRDRGEPEPKLAYTYASLGGIMVFEPIWNQHLNSWEMLMLQDMRQIDDGYVRRFIGDYETINPGIFQE